MNTMKMLKEYRYTLSSDEGEKIKFLGSNMYKVDENGSVYTAYLGYNQPINRWRMASQNYLEYVYYITIYEDDNIEYWIDDIRNLCRTFVEADVGRLEKMLSSIGTFNS